MVCGGPHRGGGGGGGGGTLSDGGLIRSTSIRGSKAESKGGGWFMVEGCRGDIQSWRSKDEGRIWFFHCQVFITKDQVIRLDIHSVRLLGPYTWWIKAERWNIKAKR